MGAQGTAIVDFGAFPGASDASVAVTGQGAILAGSAVEAWLQLTASADHSADEHMVETIQVFAGNISAGTGFTIYAVNSHQIAENTIFPVGPAALPLSPGRSLDRGGNSPRIYGKWNINWVWN
jgi:hypothetical protein